jgi:hypothetical protein
LPASQSERRRALERRITSAAKERGTTAARLRRLVGFGVLCETLSEAAARGIIPVFFVKGGVALRLASSQFARQTLDRIVRAVVTAVQDEILKDRLGVAALAQLGLDEVAERLGAAARRPGGYFGRGVRF